MSTSSPAGQGVPPPAPIAEALLTLAPLELPNHRRGRYAGDDLCLSLSDLAEEDQRTLRHLYEALTRLLYQIAGDTASVPQKWEVVQAWMQSYDLDVLIDEVRSLGVASHQSNQGELLAKTIHACAAVR